MCHPFCGCALMAPGKMAMDGKSSFSSGRGRGVASRGGPWGVMVFCGSVVRRE